MSDHLTPLEVCERLIGDLPTIETITGRRPKAAYVWRRPAQGRAPGDMPADANRDLLAYAKRRQIPLQEKHLIWGAPKQEIDDLVHAMRDREVA